jgi:hypothetical protein
MATFKVIYRKSDFDVLDLQFESFLDLENEPIGSQVDYETTEQIEVE